ncbi:MAG: TRAP transporter small permease, partial [Acidobacteria bacterium]|nr:TRAP transporter small permease [Acidobacteriota bacterium]
MVVLPLTEILGRRLWGGGIPGAISFTQHLTLWVGFLGAALAASEGKLLALATGELIPEGRFRSIARAASSTVAAGVSTLLFWASVDMIRLDKEAGLEVAAGVPVWVAQLALPIGFGLVALRLVWKASDGLWGRLPAALGLLAGCWIGLKPELLEFRPAWPGLFLVLVASLLG